MPTTCREIITLGLQLARVIPLGKDPKAKESEAGLTIMQGMYDSMVTSGMFGRLTDVYKDTDCTAREGERITADSVTVTIPATITDDGDERAPRDLACVSVVTDGVLTNVVHSGGTWEVLTDLTLDSTAPFASRGKDGLAALLALYFAEAFGTQLGPAFTRRANEFRGSLAYKLGSTDGPREGVYY